MASEGDKKTKYTREYYAYNPSRSNGPLTWILDTIVLPVVAKK